MGARRKQKLRQREERQAEAQARRRAVVERIVRAFGLESVFNRLPPNLFDGIEDRIEPGVEVVATEDSRDDPEIKDALREIRARIKRPVRGKVLGREFELAPEDLFRGYEMLVKAFHFYARRSAENKSRSRRFAQIDLLLSEASRTLADFDRRWFYEVTGTLMSRVVGVTDRTFRLDTRMIEVRMTWGWKAEGALCRRLELRLHRPRPRVVSLGGEKERLYPCQRTGGPSGLETVKWNCPSLGIEGPRVELPLLISEHALARLDERIPLDPGFRPYLHNMVIDSLSRPVFFPADRGRHLVEARMGRNRLGYFVVEVTPSFVWVVTFLFLTMAGTPEARCLHEKVGLSRRHMEGFDLDNFMTLSSSNIADDPLLAQIFSDCGCGHLLSLIEPDERDDWLSVFGERLKTAFDLREAREGFKVGRKWVRWSRQRPPAEPEAGGAGQSPPG